MSAVNQWAISVVRQKYSQGSFKNESSKKYYCSGIALALLASVAAPALAEKVEVKVTGTIASVACTPTFSGGEVIDYGKIATSNLSQTDYTLLDEMQLELAITCEVPVKLFLKVTNGRPVYFNYRVD